MKTVHIIFNAHIDPIWLWPWQSGLDEVLATCRSACDRLDAHPDVVFTRGEAWVYDQVERIDPELFGRIRGHIDAGRWEVVGGWWIQPDCNLPSGFGMERQIELVFSSPSRFFDAIWPQRESLPLVTGELQQHAIGCYSVYRPIKTAVRRAEHLLRQAELFVAKEPGFVPSNASTQIEEGWKRVCFAHFHDTYGGTCLPSAYAYPLAQLGYAQDVAETLLQESLRRKLNTLPDDPLQRIVLYNSSDTPIDGPVEFTPWLDWQSWGAGWRLLDESSATVPHQLLAPEALASNMANLLFSLKIAPGEMRVLRIQDAAPEEPETPLSTWATANRNSLFTTEGMLLSWGGLSFDEYLALEMPSVLLYDDPSDTWSHSIDRYSEIPTATTYWTDWEIEDTGPRPPITADLTRGMPHRLADI